MKSRLLVMLAVVGSVSVACRDITEPNLAPVVQLAPAAALNWVSIASMSSARQQQGAATGLNGLIYMIGGTDANGFAASSEVFNPQNNTWASIAHPGPWCCGGTARDLDGRIYIAGGENNGDPSSDVKVYDPTTNAWSPVAPLSVSRDVMTLVAGANGKLYAIGGAANGMSNRLVGSVEIFDPSAGTWSGGASMVTPRWYHASALGPDGKIYVFGGLSGFTSIASGEVYDPAADTWSPIAPMPETRYNHTAVTGGDGRIYVMGGVVSDAGTGQTVLAYDPANNSWAAAPSMNVGRTQFAASLGLDKKIYAAGGSPPSQGDLVATSAESYGTVDAAPANHPPVAFAGADQTLQCVNGGATAHLSGSGSSDPDGDPLTFAWFEGSTSLGTTAAVNPRLSGGTHSITLRVKDSKDASAEDGVVVTVKDAKAPSISFQRFDQFISKMPEGGYKLVAWIKASDDCQTDPNLTVTVLRTRIFNHSGDTDDGDGMTPKVVPGKFGGYEVYLPATHDFFHTLIYTIKAVATDASGNTANFQTWVNAIVIPYAYLPYGKLRFGH